jgi:hypothetical protein
MNANKTDLKRSLLILASSGVVLCFQNCGFVMSGQITDESLGNAIPVVGSLSSEAEVEVDHNSLSLVPICEISTTRSVAHLGEIYSFNIKEAQGEDPLPAVFNVRTYGTKSKLDGSGVVVDANESSLTTVYAAQLNFSNPGSIPGIYTRRFTVIDPDDGHTICVTNTATVKLTPACALSIAQDNIPQGQYANFQLSTAAVTAEQGVPNKTVWSGTKNGDGDGPYNLGMETQYLVGPLSDFLAVGTYTRHADVLDADNNILCRTNTVNFSVYRPSALQVGDMVPGEGGSSGGSSGGYDMNGGSSGNSSDNSGGGGGDNGI